MIPHRALAAALRHRALASTSSALCRAPAQRRGSAFIAGRDLFFLPPLDSPVGRPAPTRAAIPDSSFPRRHTLVFRELTTANCMYLSMGTVAAMHRSIAVHSISSSRSAAGQGSARSCPSDALDPGYPGGTVPGERLGAACISDCPRSCIACGNRAPRSSSAPGEITRAEMEALYWACDVLPADDPP